MYSFEQESRRGLSENELRRNVLVESILRVLGRFGIDQAVFFTAGAKLFQAGVQFAVLGVLAQRLTPHEQGYYYTFQSVLALQIFFELGMTSVLIQVTSHEAAPLDLMHKKLIPEESQAGARLSSLLHHLVRWYLSAAGLFFVCVACVGVVFFMRSQGGLNLSQWLGPWFLSTLMTAVFMVFQALIAFFEGIGRINSAARIRAAQGMGTAITLLLAMQFGAGLYSSGIALFVGIGIGFLLWIKENWRTFTEIWVRQLPALKIPWTKDLWGFQWRMALSWVSGYLIFQFSTPVVFRILGSVEAGKYGITQQVVTGFSALSMAWATTRQARWGRWIAMNDRVSLDADFKSTLKRTVGVNFGLAILFVAVMIIGQWIVPQYANRFAPLEVTIALLACGVINQVIFTEAIYLRAHKTEPFLITSIAGAIAMGFGSMLVAKRGIITISLLYLIVTVTIGLMWGTKIFFREKRRWERQDVCKS